MFVFGYTFYIFCDTMVLFHENERKRSLNGKTDLVLLFPSDGWLGTSRTMFLALRLAHQRCRQSRCKTGARAKATAERARQQSRSASGRMVLFHYEQNKHWHCHSRLIRLLSDSMGGRRRRCRLRQNRRKRGPRRHRCPLSDRTYQGKKGEINKK